jgi:hypothetical protein
VSCPLCKGVGFTVTPHSDPECTPAMGITMAVNCACLKPGKPGWMSPKSDNLG